MQISKLDQMFEILKPRPNKRLVAAWAVDAHTICAVHQAVEMDLIEGILVGDEALIKKVCAEEGIDPSCFRIVQVDNDLSAAAKAVDMINAGEGDFLMKGLLSTDRYMRAILNKEKGLMDKGAILSHVTVAEVPTYHKLLIFGDVAIIPLPDLAQKVAITNYLIRVAHFLGIKNPKVGIQAASEQTLPKIPSCAEGALIAKMAQRGQIKGAVVEGPLGFDLIVDSESARIKGIKSEVCGDADCILFPNIEAGNTFYKSIVKLMKGELCAIVMGARVPCVLTSRGDSEQSKLYSIALAALLA
ncbi:MAG TPA: phosphate acyltransferase [Candidatus Cloacimonadota bacterium]|jgi:phosphate butyryltransferase|nr:phosphate acyltransferase [Candidatus Cloacimonadota bacterium]OQC09332.1 MAG: Phosphate acetyltransferase [Candidatus Cloacimonetes bacterium ADurb.Bin088]HOG30925.1 phosphate acyltransferase [Candidatus Cloacimonadota bacterium]HOR57943.1 phosphate acyltransferase [Candidatus Cloacimonadota bacterium]HPB08378.1 phosphate acyltransferase [Candidatus Cloacimonadota bacterium]